MAFPSDLAIAQGASLEPLGDIADQMGLPRELLEPYGDDVAKIKLRAIEELADRPRAKYVVVTAITPTPLGEGKTTTTVGLGQAMPHVGQAVDDRHSPAVDGADVRHQGRRGRRRLQPGRADGDAQPAPDRRLPRGDRGAQPARRDGRQPPAPGQRARARPRATSPGAGSSTSTTARCATSSSASGAREDGVTAADRLRHHRGVRGDGDPGADAARSASCASASARIVVGYTRGGAPVTAERPQGGRGDGGDHARRGQAQPDADAREHARCSSTPARSATSRTATRR